MRRCIPVLLLCSLVVAAHAQQPAQQPTFRSGVALVTVDVSVLDKNDKPVPGLTAADFEIKLNGKVQPVRALSYVQAQNTADGQAGPALIEARGQSIETGTMRQGRQTVENGAPPGESRVFVMLVDDLSFSPHGGRGLFLAGQNFLSRLPATDLVGFATTTGVGAVNPTANRAPIAAALGNVVGEFTDPRGITPDSGQEVSNGGRTIAAGSATSGATKDNSPSGQVGIGESLEIDDGNQALLKEVITRECFDGRTELTASSSVEVLIADGGCASEVQRRVTRTAALTRQATNRQIQGYLSVIKAMAAAGGTGIKQLVILSDGLGLARDGTTLLAPVALAAATSGVRVTVLLEQHDISAADPGRRGVSSLDAAGNAVESRPQADPGMSRRRRDDDRALTNGVQLLADMVGGELKRIVGSADPFFDRTALAASALYRVGVEEPAGATPGKDFSVSVKVNRPDVVVRVNKRAVSASATNGAPASAPSMEDQLKAAINNGQPLYNVPISTATALRRVPGGTQLDLGVNVAIPARIKGPLTTAFGLVDAANSVRTGRKTIEASPDGSNYRLSFSIPVTAGTYKLRVAVADATGAVGSIETVVDAKLETMGPFSASDLLTSWTDSSGKSQFLALEDVPGNVETLNASLELYPSPGAPAAGDVQVRVGLYQRGKKEPIAEHSVEPDSGDGFLRADTEFDLGSLAPGTYVLRAVVVVGGKDVGTTQASLRKR